MQLIAPFIKKYNNFRSFKTDRKIIVIESDDWGSERTRDKWTYEQLIKINHKVENDGMTRFDTIANETDLELLFELFSQIKDSNGRSLVMTANVCTANPDFEQIRNNGFESFYYEPFYETIARRPNGPGILSLWKNGIDAGLFFPQLHGREHVHALAWLKELKAGNKDLLSAFDLGSWGIPYRSLFKQRRQNLMASLDLYGLEGEREFQILWLKESAAIFKSYFNFESATFIPPAYTWHSYIKDYLYDLGISGVQGISLQYMPNNLGYSKYKRKLHINGSKLTRQVYRITRNAFFEPYTSTKRDWVDECLHSIQFAFSNKQPVILGSHRVNFIGGIESNNRDNNLKEFKSLFDRVVKKWPDVEFKTSAELVEIMKN